MVNAPEYYPDQPRLPGDDGIRPDDLLPERIPLLVVDDDESVLQVTRLILSRFQYKGHGLEILEARNAAEARSTLQNHPGIAIVLLDVVMESDDAGLKLVSYIRNDLHNHHIRILLRTGQAGYAPERQVVQDYDINDYLLKSEVTQSRLLLSLTTAIRGYSDIRRAERLALRIGEAERSSLLAQKASIAKTQFLAHMSHEIRTPLNGIAGIVELLSQTNLSDEQRALIRDLRYASESLLGVVNDVLDVAKIEAGKLELNPVDFSLPQLIEKVCAVFSASMLLKGIDFRIEQAEDIPDRLHGDPQRIQQILINYLSNALKFTPAGGQVILRAQTTADEYGHHVLLEVEDNGRGIRLERLADIFNAYEQESAQTSALFGGTGLGLSLSRSLAELMQGKVGADSAPGQGSRFWLQVYLKAAQSQPVLQTLAQSAVPKPLLGRRIVVCEDDATSRKVMQRMLEHRGARVMVFEHGQQLIDSGVFESADVIVLDFHMPVLDGIATARALRQHGCDKPILALTAAATESEQEQCMAAGMNAVLNKPVEWESLFNWLGRY